MSSDLAIRVEHLGKLYPTGRRGRTLRDRIAAFAGITSAVASSEWALDDVSFELRRGRALGVVGENGAGKSTLLRILARITEPTRGRVELRGSVASILDIGAGFHSELSGRENVHLGGAILGMTRAEVAAKFDAIVAFAELESVIDLPMKTYSTGMHLRLAFAVAAHLDSDVLLLDEVIAVGDVRFQRRCLARMSELVRDGRSVVLVSHSLELVRRFCQDAIFLDRGRVRASGPTNAVVDAYLSAAVGAGGAIRFDPPEPLGSGAALVAVTIEADDGTGRVRFASRERITIRISIAFDAATVRRIGIVVRSNSFEDLASSLAPPELLRDVGRSTMVCVLPADVLSVGEYSVDVVAVEGDDRAHVARSSRPASFAIVADASDVDTSIRLGAIRIAADWSVATEPER